VNLQPLSLASDSAIQYAFFLEKDTSSSDDITLVTRFSGVYRIGHLGAPDAHFMKRMVDIAYLRWQPARLILDFSDLDYQWGDEMDFFTGYSWNMANTSWDTDTDFWKGEDISCALVVGEKCIEAISTLCFGVESARVATELPHIFDNLEDACNFVNDAPLLERLKQEHNERMAERLAGSEERQHVDPKPLRTRRNR
jgi:hypothetical protein